MQQLDRVQLSKAVPDSIQHGKHQVTAVTDIYSNQDLVEAVPHLSPGTEDSHHDDDPDDLHVRTHLASTQMLSMFTHRPSNPTDIITTDRRVEN